MSDTTTDRIVEATADEFRDGDVVFGTFYPKHHVVATFGERAEAEAFGADLGALDHRVWAPHEVKARHAAYVAQANPIEKVTAMLAEERRFLDQYLEEAAAGTHFVTVYAPDDEQLDAVREAVKRHPVRRAHYYGELTVDELSRQ
jgi:hypothetical protein